MLWLFWWIFEWLLTFVVILLRRLPFSGFSESEFDFRLVLFLTLWCWEWLSFAVFLIVSETQLENRRSQTDPAKPTEAPHKFFPNPPKTSAKPTSEGHWRSEKKPTEDPKIWNLPKWRKKDSKHRRNEVNTTKTPYWKKVVNTNFHHFFFCSAG